ncbi:MAG: cation:proton antiporter [Acidimicrobiales bacterium]
MLAQRSLRTVPRASVTTVLLHVLIVLVAAKVAAEMAERAHVPPVVGEILAGVLIGPSALALVGGDAVLSVLAELGVILLLLQVGMEMDLAELGAVGPSSLVVACVGVVVPFIGGAAMGAALGMAGKEAIFVGAALTATSVGITARVFGDLYALATVEARTVLGAAVADDVIGLVMLTVVVKVVSGGSVAPLSVAWVVVLAIAFLVVTAMIGVRVVPPLFAMVQRQSQSAGTLVGLALAFTLGVAELAQGAGLAPIVGAFVAGISLSSSRAADRIRRDLAPVGHLFVPVFFLQIGIDADVRRFADPGVLRLAAVLLAVAVAGKLASAGGMLGRGDRLLVGIGMIPRGEVGLIFATLGLRQHVYGDDVYAALLLVVLVTTLVTPPALRWRLGNLRARARASPSRAAPPEGWLRVPAANGELVELAAEPPAGDALAVAMQAALACETHRPGPELLAWLAGLPPERLQWSAQARRQLLHLLDEGGPRAWRFLAVTGVLARALPELAEALGRRQADAGQVDPLEALRWPTLARLRERTVPTDLRHPERLLLAAIVLDATDGGPDQPVVVARRLVQRLDLGAAAEQAVAGLVEDSNLLPAAARRLDALSQEPVLQLAAHLGSLERARAQYLLALATANGDAGLSDRLAALDGLLQQALTRNDLVGREASNAVEARKARAARLTVDPAVAERIAAAPRAYVLEVEPADLARQAALCEPAPGRSSVRVAVSPVADDHHLVELVAADRVGLVAAETRVLADLDLDVVGAVVATWGDGCALGSFTVSGVPPDPHALQARMSEALDDPPRSPPLAGARLQVDNDASPWHTVAIVEALDHRGLLHQITTAFAAAGASVHTARLSSAGGLARDQFELTDRSADKLDEGTVERIGRLLTEGVTPSRWVRLWRQKRDR